MVHVNGTKIKAFELRKNGKSYREIAKELTLPKSTLAYWFQRIDWSKDIKLQLIRKAQTNNKERLKKLIAKKKVKFAELYQRATKEAREEFSQHKNNLLFIIGLLVYWGEGDKNFDNGIIRVSNTDPVMIKIFRTFLIEICHCDLSRVKGWLLLYSDLDPELCLKYWISTTNIPETHFTKSGIIQGRHKTHRLPYGVCTIQTSNKYLKKKLLTWLELYKKEIDNMRV